MEVIEEYQVIELTETPVPMRFVIPCPVCSAGLEYEPAEDDAGCFYALEEFPVCEPCNVMVVPPVVQVRKVDGPYFADRH